MDISFVFNKIWELLTASGLIGLVGFFVKRHYEMKEKLNNIYNEMQANANAIMSKDVSFVISSIVYGNGTNEWESDEYLSNLEDVLYKNRNIIDNDIINIGDTFIQ